MKIETKWGIFNPKKRGRFAPSEEVSVLEGFFLKRLCKRIVCLPNSNKLYCIAGGRRNSTRWDK